MNNIFDTIPEYDYTFQDRYLELMILFEYNRGINIGLFPILSTSCETQDKMYVFNINVETLFIRISIYSCYNKSLHIRNRYSTQFDTFKELYKFVVNTLYGLS